MLTSLQRRVGNPDQEERGINWAKEKKIDNLINLKGQIHFIIRWVQFPVIFHLNAPRFRKRASLYRSRKPFLVALIWFSHTEKLFQSSLLPRPTDHSYFRSLSTQTITFLESYWIHRYRSQDHSSISSSLFHPVYQCIESSNITSSNMNSLTFRYSIRQTLKQNRMWPESETYRLGERWENRKKQGYETIQSTFLIRGGMPPSGTWSNLAPWTSRVSWKWWEETEEKVEGMSWRVRTGNEICALISIQMEEAEWHSPKKMVFPLQFKLIEPFLGSTRVRKMIRAWEAKKVEKVEVGSANLIFWRKDEVFHRRCNSLHRSIQQRCGMVEWKGRFLKS